MKVEITCTYCGHIWVETVYGKYDLENKRCTNGECKDRRLVVKDIASKIDYYVGCPPFPEKDNKTSSTYSDMYDDMLRTD